jgi:hypothetical protein
MFTKNKKNLRVNKHYHVTHNCLKKCLENLLPNVLLILVLTYKLLSVTSFIAISKKGFEISKHKDSAQFVANLVTHILWFL